MAEARLTRRMPPLEWIPVVGFIVLGVRLHALTWTIKVANDAARPVPELVMEAWILHGRWTVAFLSTLVAVAAIVLGLTLLSVGAL